MEGNDIMSMAKKFPAAQHEVLKNSATDGLTVHLVGQLQHLVAGPSHVLHSSSKKSTRISISTSNGETLSGVICKEICQLINLRFAEVRNSTFSSNAKHNGSTPSSAEKWMLSFPDGLSYRLQ